MTINNSGGVAKYDGMPMPSKMPSSQQFGESLDDILPAQIEQPIRKYASPASDYPAIIPAPKYPLMKI